MLRVKLRSMVTKKSVIVNKLLVPIYTKSQDLYLCLTLLLRYVMNKLSTINYPLVKTSYGNKYFLYVTISQTSRLFSSIIIPIKEKKYVQICLQK